MKDILVTTIERIYKKHVTKEVVDVVETGGWASAVWGILTDSEIVNVALAEEHGGAGGDITDLLGLYHITGKYAVPIPVIEATLANLILQQCGGKPTANNATIHLQKGVQIKGGQATAIVANVPWARHVEELVTVAEIDNQLAIIHVSLQDADITLQQNLASEPRDTVVLKQAQILQQYPITAQKWQLFTCWHTAAKNAQMVGAIDRVFELTVRYTKEREQFGRPLHRFQLVQQHIAHLAGEQAMASAAFENMSAALLKGTALDEVAYTTICLDEAIRTVTASAHQVHAAVGVTHEHRLHQYTRRLWAWREEGFTASYWKKERANALLTATEEDFWTYLTSTK